MGNYNRSHIIYHYEQKCSIVAPLPHHKKEKAKPNKEQCKTIVFLEPLPTLQQCVSYSFTQWECIMNFLQIPIAIIQTSILISNSEYSVIPTRTSCIHTNILISNSEYSVIYSLGHPASRRTFWYSESNSEYSIIRTRTLCMMLIFKESQVGHQNVRMDDLNDDRNLLKSQRSPWDSLNILFEIFDK